MKKGSRIQGVEGSRVEELENKQDKKEKWRINLIPILSRRYSASSATGAPTPVQT
jgi:hypothetical protein